MERVARIELANKPWQGFRLPLHHTRIIRLQNSVTTHDAYHHSSVCLYIAMDPRTNTKVLRDDNL